MCIHERRRPSRPRLRTDPPAEETTPTRRQPAPDAQACRPAAVHATMSNIAPTVSLEPLFTDKAYQLTQDVEA